MEIVLGYPLSPWPGEREHLLPSQCPVDEAVEDAEDGRGDDQVYQEVEDVDVHLAFAGRRQRNGKERERERTFRHGENGWHSYPVVQSSARACPHLLVLIELFHLLSFFLKHS